MRSDIESRLTRKVLGSRLTDAVHLVTSFSHTSKTSRQGLTEVFRHFLTLERAHRTGLLCARELKPVSCGTGFPLLTDREEIVAVSLRTKQ